MLHRLAALLLASTFALIVSLSPRRAEAAPPRSRVVTVDVIEVIDGRPPKLHRVTLFVHGDNAPVTVKADGYVVVARLAERQPSGVVLKMLISRPSASGTVVGFGGTFRFTKGLWRTCMGVWTKKGGTEVMLSVR